MDIINEKKNIQNIPKKNICVIISSPNGIERNFFLDELEKKIHIDYGGSYKNNIPRRFFISRQLFRVNNKRIRKSRLQLVG
jgi:hypothetical protein